MEQAFTGSISVMGANKNPDDYAGVTGAKQRT
jgi:hypothetical protein